MEKKWSVDVSVNGENILTIGSDWLSGKASLTDEDENTIEEAAKSLLSFIGRPLNNVNRPDANDMPPNICIECGDFGPHCNKCTG